MVSPAHIPGSLPNKYFLTNTTGTLKAPVEAWNNYNLNSLFGILNLSYSNYLYLQVSGRNDWSSTLPLATSSYFYPAASLSWVFTENINALKNISWLNYGKLKASYAKSANGANPYQSTYTYNYFRYFQFNEWDCSTLIRRTAGSQLSD